MKLATLLNIWCLRDVGLVEWSDPYCLNAEKLDQLIDEALEHRDGKFFTALARACQTPAADSVFILQNAYAALKHSGGKFDRYDVLAWAQKTGLPDLSNKQLARHSRAAALPFLLRNPPKRRPLK